MDDHTDHSPLHRLLAYQRRALRLLAADPVVRDDRSEWSGLAFRLGDQQMLAVMSDVAEVVDLPECVPVPNTRPWFLGVSNVRGNFVPVSDLHIFLHRLKSPSSRNQRLLICPDGDSLVGLVVDEIIGLRHFYLEDQTLHTGSLPGHLPAYVSASFPHDAGLMPVFQVDRLLESDDFCQIARR